MTDLHFLRPAWLLLLFLLPLLLWALRHGGIGDSVAGLRRRQAASAVA